MMDDSFEDEAGKPVWIKDPDTGEILAIERDREYASAVRKFYDEECQHPSTEPMRVSIADGRVQVSNCCTNCGARVGTALSQKDKAWVSSLPWLQDVWADTYNARRRREMRDILLRIARKQRDERGRFTNSYREYLSSPEWAARRRKVMARCGGVCEGCGDYPATEVHHLTYEHFRSEFLFELVGLCHGCHERIHEEGRA